MASILFTSAVCELYFKLNQVGIMATSCSLSRPIRARGIPNNVDALSIEITLRGLRTVIIKSLETLLVFLSTSNFLASNSYTFFMLPVASMHSFCKPFSHNLEQVVELDN